MIVVDNGSTDDTASVIQSFEGKLPISRVYEAAPGLSNARNSGVAAAQGAYILWTDDDVIIDPDWIRAYVAAFETFPEAALFGGKICPLLLSPTPNWFSQNKDILEWVVAALDFGDGYQDLSVADRKLPYGANYAVRGVEQRRFLYDPSLGVAKAQRRIGEESTVFRAILNAGAAGHWVPGARVDHLIPASRQTTKYVCDYFRGHGETFAFVACTTGTHARWGLTLNYGLRAAANAIMFYGLRPLAPARLWLPRLKNLGYCLGVLDYMRVVCITHTSR
jgi:glycosyltransferase involved in cell wall biosynthesis